MNHQPSLPFGFPDPTPIAPPPSPYALRWDCRQRGCFNRLKRPKLEVLSECLPGRIGFTDIDAAVEIGGRFLFLEFKGGQPRPLPAGQRIFFERLTRLSENVVAAAIAGDAATMAVDAVSVIYRGQVYPWQSCDLPRLQERVWRWGERAIRPT